MKVLQVFLCGAVALTLLYLAYQKGRKDVYQENSKIYAAGLLHASERSDMPTDYLNFLLARYYYSANRADLQTQEIRQKIDAPSLRGVPIGKGPTTPLEEQDAYFKKNGLQ